MKKIQSNLVRLRPRGAAEPKPRRDEAELHYAIARVESLLREGKSEREIEREIRNQFAA
jgi:hypothetical protein